MPIEVTGKIFKSYTDRFFDALDKIPEDKHDYVLWKGTFSNQNGQDAVLQSQTPAQMGADVSLALDLLLKLTKDEAQISPELFTKVRAEMKALAERPLREISATGREIAKRVAPEIDALTAEQLEKLVPGFNGMVTAREHSVWMLTHVVHHRGQLHQILRSIGIEPPPFF